MEYKFSEQHMQQYLDMLGEIPAKYSLDLIFKIQSDCTAQQKKAKEEKKEKK